MKNVLAFFRDTLNGPLYYGVSLVCFILICICIYILRRIDLKEKKAEKEGRPIRGRPFFPKNNGKNEFYKRKRRYHLIFCRKGDKI